MSYELYGGWVNAGASFRDAKPRPKPDRPKMWTVLEKGPDNRWRHKRNPDVKKGDAKREGRPGQVPLGYLKMAREPWRPKIPELPPDTKRWKASAVIQNLRIDGNMLRRLARDAGVELRPANDPKRPKAVFDYITREEYEKLMWQRAYEVGQKILRKAERDAAKLSKK